METSGVMGNILLLGLRKVTARGNSKRTTHSQSNPPSPECSGIYRGKTKVLDKTGNKRSGMVLYNRMDWDHFKIIQKIHKQHSRKP